MIKRTPAFMETRTGVLLAPVTGAVPNKRGSSFPSFNDCETSEIMNHLSAVGVVNDLKAC